jgi:hypothetical protein
MHETGREIPRNRFTEAKSRFCTVLQLGYQLNVLNGNMFRKIFWRNSIEKGKDQNEINLKVGTKKGTVSAGGRRWDDRRNR